RLLGSLQRTQGNSFVQRLVCRSQDQNAASHVQRDYVPPASELPAGAWDKATSVDWDAPADKQGIAGPPGASMTLRQMYVKNLVL
ncbi:MAG: hypothetical protein ABR528_08490, partial [Pseudonocardiaceae bacterium]